MAARLVGLSGERIRQLIRGGYAVSAGRGYVRLPSLLSGYVRFLRAEASRPESEGMTRGHEAKAELIEAATARRRAELIERTEAETALEVIHNVAARHLKTLTSKKGAARGLPDTVRARVAAEVEVALTQIGDAHQAARQALRTGDFTALEGAR